MNDWIKQNVGYNKVLLTVFVALVSFFAVKVYDKVDAMPDKFVRAERYICDQHRIEEAVCEIQRDVKEILKALK